MLIANTCEILDKRFELLESLNSVYFQQTNENKHMSLLMEKRWGPQHNLNELHFLFDFPFLAGKSFHREHSNQTLFHNFAIPIDYIKKNTSSTHMNLLSFVLFNVCGTLHLSFSHMINTYGEKKEFLTAEKLISNPLLHWWLPRVVIIDVHKTLRKFSIILLREVKTKLRMSFRYHENCFYERCSVLLK
jgi:hypothetical protein